VTLRRKILFWVILTASISILAVPSVVLFENIRKFARTTPEDPGLAPTRTDRVPHAPLRPGSAQAPGMAQPQFVRFTLKVKAAKAVFLEGDFNLWRKDKLPMKPAKKNEWTALVPLPSGRYHYRFVVDGKELADPGNPESEKVDDELVSVKVVP
jgi:hypothetical protein